MNLNHPEILSKGRFQGGRGLKCRVSLQRPHDVEAAAARHEDVTAVHLWEKKPSPAVRNEPGRGPTFEYLLPLAFECNVLASVFMAPAWFSESAVDTAGEGSPWDGRLLWEEGEQGCGVSLSFDLATCGSCLHLFGIIS